MKKKRFLMLITIIMGAVLFALNSRSILAEEIVAMVKDLKGSIWLTTEKERVEIASMQELKKGDRLEVAKGSGVTVLYYYSEVEERYLEDSTVEIGKEHGIIHKGKAERVEETREDPFIKIDTNLPTSLKSQEEFGAFALRGNPPPPPSKYFDAANIHRYAVIIGISKFKDTRIPALKYADRDAQSFYDFLVSPTGGSFDPGNILLLKNEAATLKDVKDGLTNFLKKAVDEDFVIIYFASHGEPEPDRPKNLYLLTYDSELDKLASTAYHMENVNLDMKRYISAKRLIFLADACHAGAIAGEGFGARGFSNPISNALLALSTTKEGWAIITASRGGEVSLESDKWGNGHGAFTYFLLEGLNGKADVAGNYNGIVTLAEAFDYLENRVKRATQNAQHPVIAGNFDNNLPLGFLPVIAQKKEKPSDISTVKEPQMLTGTIQLGSDVDDANIFINGKFIGKTSTTAPVKKELSAGAAKLSIKKKDLPDYERVIYINPDETSNVYVAMRSVPSAEQGSTITKTTTVTGDVAKEKFVEPKVDEAELKSGIDKLIKELEEMRMKQMAAEGHIEEPKARPETKPETIAQPVGIPISIKRFTVNMKALSEQRAMDILQTRVIDELVKDVGISVVERDLQYQEEILREQRLGGSILADRMFRIELGKILGADFICFSRAFPAYDTDDIILRMEIVETATTLVDTIEHSFKSGDISSATAKEIAMKIKDRIAKKRKL